MSAVRSREEIEFDAATTKKYHAQFHTVGAQASLNGKLAELREEWKAAEYAGVCEHLTFAPRSHKMLVSVQDECIRCGSGRMWQ